MPESPTILIVEDNELNRDMLTRRLSRLGFETIVAIDGLSSLGIAREKKPHLILLDLRLPDITGNEVAQNLKADPTTAHIPIIALTAHAMPGDREAALAAGCNDYDTKPVDLPRLLEKIATLLPQSA